MSSTEELKKELEREYSPSMWSKRFSTRDEVLYSHVNFVTAESNAAVKMVPCELDKAYGPSPNQKFDIFGTDLPNDSPILVYIHGGFWQELSRQQSRYAVIPLHRAKVKTIVIGYDLCPKVSLREILQQIFNACKIIFDYADQMQSRGIYFAGHSAGAHLVASVISNEDFLKYTPGTHRLRGAFLISGVFDLRNLIHTTVNDALGLNYDESIALSPYLKNYYHLRDRRIRVYVIVGENESTAFKRQSRDFYELLVNCCLVQNMYFQIKDDFDHFDIVECFASEDNYLRNLLVHDIRKYLD